MNPINAVMLEANTFDYRAIYMTWNPDLQTVITDGHCLLYAVYALVRSVDPILRISLKSA